MPITEATCHHLLTQLEATIGKEAAMTLAEHLPPVGWADVATKSDLDHLQADLRAELHTGLAAVRAELHTELTRQSRHFTTALLASTGVIISANAAVIALVQLA